MLKVDFHCHTFYSRDSLNKIPELLKITRKKGFDKLAITDHNTISGAKEAYSIDPELIIIGEEIRTTQGELLAFFVKEEIPPDLSPQKTISLLKQQGAFICAAHPFDLRRRGWYLENLLAILPDLDAIEVFNARSYNPLHNQQALNFAKQHNIPKLAGSDAHTKYEIGKVSNNLPDFTNAIELKQSIKHNSIEGHTSSPFVSFLSMIARIKHT